MKGCLDERQRRLWAASEARSFGRGGLAAVARVTGLAQTTVRRGIVDLQAGEDWRVGRVRRPGAGRPSVTARDPGVEKASDGLLEPVTIGDPERVSVRWTSKSAAKPAAELREMGHDLVDRTVLRMLGAMGFSMQGNRKTQEGPEHPDRDAQFTYINETVAAALDAQQPVVAADTKKNELVGEFRNGGREWTPKGEPIEVNTNDFPSHARGKATPYGVYDIANNEGSVSFGISADTAQFVANSITAWWAQPRTRALPQRRDPHAHSRLGRVEESTRPAVAARARPARRQDRDPDPGIALPAANLEMEPDRASPIQLHQHQLARQAADQLPSDHQPDQRDGDHTA